MEIGKNKISLVTILSALIYLLIPFLPLITSGNWEWWQGWTLGALSIFFAVISRVLTAIKNPDLLVERSRYTSAEGIKEWDRRLVPIISIFLPILTYIVLGLDKRFTWTQPFSPIWIWTGFVLIILGFIFSNWAMLENRYFSAVVRIQSDRGHQVIQGGPYRIIRHPGYAGGIVSYLAIPLFMNSWWGYIPMLAACILMVLRTYLEDQTLQSELPGYAEYAQRTRYRLIPGVW